MSQSVITIVIYVILVMAVIGGIGAVAYFTSGFTTDFQTFYLRLNGEDIIGETSNLELRDGTEYLFEVKYVFNKVSKNPKSGYSVQIIPCVQDNDFSYTVNGETHLFSELNEELTQYFDIIYNLDSLSIMGDVTLQEILQRIYPESDVEILELAKADGDHFTMIVWSYDKKACVKVNFHGADGILTLDKQEIVF